MNNLKINSIKTVNCSEYFGFTESEVKKLVSYYDVREKFDEIKKWYDGYLFGKTEIYNPWSVLNYISTAIKNLDAPADRSNDIIHELILKGDRSTKSDEYLVESNRESGTGWNDIIIKNVLTREIAVILEIKSVGKNETLDQMCNAALKQIEDRQYEVGLVNEDYKKILKYGISFEEKRCMVKNKKN